MAFELMQKTLDLIFPQLCLHCQVKTEKQILCSHCVESLELLEKEDLAIYRQQVDLAVIAFAKTAVVESMLLHLKKGLRPLNKIAASYMVCQLEKENIAIPDVIVPLPTKRGGYKLNESLALEIGKLFERPIKRLFLPLPISILGTSLVVKKSSLMQKKVLLVMAQFDQDLVQKAILELKKKAFQNISLIALSV